MAPAKQPRIAPITLPTTGTGTPTTAPTTPPSRAPHPARGDPPVAAGEPEAEPQLEQLAQQSERDHDPDRDEADRVKAGEQSKPEHHGAYEPQARQAKRDERETGDRAQTQQDDGHRVIHGSPEPAD